MTVPTVACTNCGKPFTTDDLRGTHCRYCGALLAHHARAQQQVAVIKELLADRNGNGIPDAYEGLVANATANATGAAMGVMGQPVGTPMMQGPVPPMMGMPPPMAPMPQVHAANALAARVVTRTAVSIAIVVASLIALSVIIIIGITVFFFMGAAPA